MKSVLFLLLFLCIIPNVAQAQEKTADKKFWVVNGIFVASTIYDVESTFFVLGRCDTCREANPIIRPFVEMGRPATYIFISAADVVTVYGSYYLKKRGHDKLWLIPPLVGIAGHGFVGTWNIKIALRF